MTALAAVLLSLGLASAHADQAPAIGSGAPMTADGLMRLTEAELEAVYAAAEPGPVPDGPADGVANSAPGSCFGAFTREFFHALWQGKTFDAASGTLVNRTAVGNTASAKVYPGTSRSDGRPCIVIDYRESDNILARGVSDEIRMVRPGLYLGVAYLKCPPLTGKYRKWLYFALQFPPKA